MMILLWIAAGKKKTHLSAWLLLFLVALLLLWLSVTSVIAVKAAACLMTCCATMHFRISLVVMAHVTEALTPSRRPASCASLFTLERDSILHFCCVLDLCLFLMEASSIPLLISHSFLLS